MVIKVKGSENLKKFIKEVEGFSPTPYDDLGVPAIGYGQRGFDPKLSQISREEADQLFDNHLSKIEQEVGKRIKRSDLTQSQQDAILDAAYNMGVEKLDKEYNFFKRVNSGDNEDIANFFRTANKARVNGKLTPLPGLVKRANQRSNWWSDSSSANMANTDIDSAIDSAIQEVDDPTNSNIDEAIQYAGAFSAQDSQNDIDAAIDAAIGVSSSGAKIKDSLDMADYEDYNYVNQAERLAKKIGVSQEDAEAALLDDSYENIVVRAESDILANSFPNTAEFMSVPENLPLIADNLEAAKKLEILTRPNEKSFTEAWGEAWEKNALATEKYATVLSLVSNISSPEEFAKDYAQISREMTTGDYGETFNRHIRKFAKISQQGEEEIAKAEREFNEALIRTNNNLGEPGQENLDATIAYLKKLGVFAESVVDKTIAIADSKESAQAFLVQQTESLTGTLSSYFGMLVGGGIGLGTTGPAGARVGGQIGAGLSTAVFSYAEKIDTEIQRKLEENPDLDVAQFVQTPEFQEILDGAKIYAGIQGGFDVVSTATLGKFMKGAKKPKGAIADSFTKRFLKATTDKTTGVVKEGLSQAVQEGVQQATSDTAYNVYVGRSGPEETGKVAMNAIEEAFGAFGPGALAGPSVHYGAKLLSKTADTIPTLGPRVKKTARKMAPMMKQSGQAMKDYAKSVNMSEQIRSFKEKGSKLENYVRSLLKKQRTEEQKRAKSERDQAPVENINVSDDEVITNTLQDEQVEEETVTVDSRVLSILLEQEGVDVDQFFVDMGDSEYRTYRDNSRPGNSITIPRYKWEIAVSEFPEISAIARYNSNEFTAIEGEQVSDALREKPEQFMMPEDIELERRPDRGDGPSFAEEDGTQGPEDQDQEVEDEEGLDSVPPVIEDPERMTRKQRVVADEPPSVEQLEAEGVMEEPVLRQVELRSQFQNQDERDVFKKLVAQLRAATDREYIDVEEADALAEMHFQHLRNRANMLGKTVKEIADENYFTALTREEEISSPGLGGYFSRTPGRVFNSFIALRKGKVKGGRKNPVRTAIHEMGHLYLHEMATDWDYIHNIPEEELTAEQREYKFAMDYLAEQYGPKMREHLDKVDVTQLDKNQLAMHLMLKTAMDQQKEKYGLDTLKPLVDYGFAADKDPMFNELIKAVHESWAQTTETYILEGKFKNSRIRRVLESLRKYIAKFAELVASSYPQYPALKIDQNVERVFNAILGGSDAVERISYPMFPDLTFDPSVFGADGQAVVEAIEEAYSDQIAEVYSKIFNQNLNDRDKVIDAYLDAAQEEAEENLRDKNFAVAKRSFDEAYEKFKNKEIDVDPRLSFDSVVEFLFDGDENQAMKWKKTLGIQFVSGKKKKTSTTIPQLMEALNISDTNDMRSIIENASNYEFFVEREASKILDRMNPILKTDEEIHQITLDTMANYKKDKYLKKTMKIMADKAMPQLKKMVKQGMLPASYIEKKLDKGYVESEAIKLLGKTKFKLSKPKQMLAMSQRYGKKAADRFGKQQFFDAFESKIQEAIAYKAFQIAQELQRDVKRTELRVAKITKMNPKRLAKTHDLDGIKYLKTIIPMILGDKKGRHLVRSVPEFTRDMLFNSENFTDEMIDSVNRARDEFLSALDNKQPNDMTYSDYAKLLRFWTRIIGVSKSAKSIEQEGINVNAAEIATEMAQIIYGHDVSPYSIMDMISKGKLTGESLLQAVMGNEFYFSSDVQTLVKAFTNSSSKTEFEFNAARKRIVDLLKKAEKKDGNIKGASSLIAGLGLNGKKPKEIKLKNSRVVLENGIYDVIMILLNMGSDSNIQRLSENGIGTKGTKIFEYDFGLGDIDLEAFNQDLKDLADQGVLKKEHIDLVQGIFDEFKMLYPYTKKAIRTVDGYEIGEIEARPIDTPFGRIEGGYYPLVYERRDRIARERSGAEIFSPTNDDTNFVKDFYPAQSKGFENTRQSRFDAPISSDFTRLTFHIQQQHKIAWTRIPAHNLGKVLSNPMIEDAVESTFKGGYKDVLLPWYDRILAQQHTKYDSKEDVNTVMRFLRRGTSVRLFLGNFWSVGKQYVGLVQALRIAGKEMIGQAYQLTSSPTAFKEAVARAEKESIFMKNRRKEYARSITKGYESLEVEQGLISKSAENVEKMAFFLMQNAQNHVDMIVWNTVYEKTGSVARADDAVKKSQGSTAIEDLSNLQFGDDTKKLFVQFLTPVIGQFEQIAIAERESRGLETSERVKALLPVFLMQAIIPGLILGAITKFRWGDDDEDYATAMAKGALRETMGNLVPVAGEFAYSGIFEGRVSFSPTLDVITREIPKARKGIINSATGVGMTSKEFSALAGLATIFSGGSVPAVVFGWLQGIYDSSKSQAVKRREATLRREKLKRIRERERRGRRRNRRRD